MQSFLGIRHKNIRFKKKICPFVLLSKEKMRSSACHLTQIRREHYEKSLQRGFSWKSSWEAENAQLAKYFFSTGKKYFLSWIIIFFQLGNSECPFGCVFVRFCPCFCWFWELGRKCVGWKNVYNWRRCVIYTIIGTSACRVRNVFGPYITGGRCTQRPYNELEL